MTVDGQRMPVGVVTGQARTVAMLCVAEGDAAAARRGGAQSRDRSVNQYRCEPTGVVMAGGAVRCGDARHADVAAGRAVSEGRTALMGGVVVHRNPVGLAAHQDRQPARLRRADHGAHGTIPLIDAGAESFPTDCVGLIASDEVEELSEM